MLFDGYDLGVLIEKCAWCEKELKVNLRYKILQEFRSAKTSKHQNKLICLYLISSLRPEVPAEVLLCLVLCGVRSFLTP